MNPQFVPIPARRWSKPGPSTVFLKRLIGNWRRTHHISKRNEGRHVPQLVHIRGAGGCFMFASGIAWWLAFWSHLPQRVSAEIDPNSTPDAGGCSRAESAPHNGWKGLKGLSSKLMKCRIKIQELREILARSSTRDPKECH
ncbi:uncharacterized protein BO88DRAFT_265423 [Aspergillus vadensis CBS 113365]|uniref:Uncharacterized protein n=1 Tax=Aspergillus vadensis (strain CBS 113365 / IMI 142717 / IBT 24658) TaxID=1448311 RepID=A0A319CPY5_ASPVC|nr:hypothetical protein BO88DRAFT_265423 [Aspergillus vadensis CBS 113365]PYH70472.1 hypothetical protein BO88DRAFT_265423 [Aspergillus vadensis CBS 113365]